MSSDKTAAAPDVQSQICLHPILFAVYPVLQMFAVCYEHYEWTVIARPIVASVAVTALLWWGLTRSLKDASRAALAMFPLWLGFYSHRVVVQVWKANGDSFPPDHWVLRETLGYAALWAVALGLAWLFARPVKHRPALNYCLNVFAMVLIVLPVFHLYLRSLETSKAAALIEPASQAIRGDLPHAAPGSSSGGVKPDIYFIVLDSYGRADVLDEFYGFDNSGFLNFLRERGFTVLDRATANYGHTPLSISSTINFQYVGEMLGDQDVSWVRDFRFYRELLRDSRLVRFLKNEGYSIASASSIFDLADMPGADSYATRWWFLNRFETLLLEMTPMPWLAHKLGWPLLYDLHRAQVTFGLDQLPNLAALPGPKFVYAHIFCPHPPFVLGPRGEAKTPAYAYSWEGAAKLFDFFDLPGTSQDLYRKDFIGQTQYVNARMKQILPAILDSSPTPPVIVLQSDHGPSNGDWVTNPTEASLRERFAVLNAIYLPGERNPDLPADTSLVNTFRLVLNHAFGAALPLIENKSYWAAFEMPYQYRQLSFSGGERAALPTTRPDSEPDHE